LYTTLPALVTIDAFYGATPTSSLLTIVSTTIGGTSYDSALELHNMGYSDPNVWSILGSYWGADPNSAFYSQYDADATGTTSGYTTFINAVYQHEFGSLPSPTSLQSLLSDIPGMTALLSGPGNPATPIQVMGGLYGYLLYVGQADSIGHYAYSADAFLQAAANGTAVYGPELTQEFPGVFLQGPGGNMTTVTAVPNEVFVATNNTNAQINGFSTTQGDTLDISAVLNGLSPSQLEIANIGAYVSLATPTADGSGGWITDVTVHGPGGGAAVALDSSVKISTLEQLYPSLIV
jgi:hypothetical protein